MKRLSLFATPLTVAVLATGIVLTPLAALADDGVETEVETDTPIHVLEDKGYSHEGTGLLPANVAADVSSRQEERLKKQDDHIEKIAERADAAVENRINLLEKLSERIDSMKRISSDDRNSLSAEISAQITALTELKARIASDTSTTSVKADAKSIAPDFRIYALVAPKAAITAGADRVLAITTQMTTVGTKLEARISDAKAAGKDMTTSDAAYADFQAKVADAKTEAQAAITLVADLQVDNGDATVRASNTAALKSAREKLKAADADLRAARTDMKTIILAIKGTGVHAEASTTAETN